MSYTLTGRRTRFERGNFRSTRNRTAFFDEHTTNQGVRWIVRFYHNLGEQEVPVRFRY